MNKKSLKMPKGYTAMWLVFSAAYAIWMSFFMNFHVLTKYETVAQRTVDGILHNDITGMIGNHWAYPIWVIVSTLCLLAFILYIKKFLYSGENTKGGKIFCLISLIFGCAFITWYGFFNVREIFGEEASITASMIGLEYPWHFRMWGVFTSLSVFANTLYMYNRYGYNSRLGVILGSIGSAAIFVTINCPSAGEDLHLDSARCMAHWSGALIFAALCAAPMLLFLFKKTREKNKKFTIAFISFGVILLAMLVLLVTVGKSGTIENIPVWAAYLIFFLANFTNVFESKKLPEKETVKA